MGNNVWIKDQITYLWNEDAKILTIQKEGDSGITIIENYVNDALYIKLEKPTADPITADGIERDPLIFDLNGDFDYAVRRFCFNPAKGILKAA